MSRSTLLLSSLVTAATTLGVLLLNAPTVSAGSSCHRHSAHSKTHKTSSCSGKRSHDSYNKHDNDKRSPKHNHKNNSSKSHNKQAPPKHASKHKKPTIVPAHVKHPVSSVKLKKHNHKPHSFPVKHKKIVHKQRFEKCVGLEDKIDKEKFVYRPVITKVYHSERKHKHVKYVKEHENNNCKYRKPVKSQHKKPSVRQTHSPAAAAVSVANPVSTVASVAPTPAAKTALAPTGTNLLISALALGLIALSAYVARSKQSV